MLSGAWKNPTIRLLCTLLIVEVFSLASSLLNQARHPLPYGLGDIVVGLIQIVIGLTVLAITYVFVKRVWRKW